MADFTLIWGILAFIFYQLTNQFVEEKQIWHLFAILNSAWILSALITIYRK
jgi:predicted membrane channel-forming protein YqfA (hemolysin III family)